MINVRSSFSWALQARPFKLPLLGGAYCTLFWAEAGKHYSPNATPLLALHSVNAAASAIEMMPLLTEQSSHRPVFAIDLPGFGASSKRDVAYTPQNMRDAVLAATQWIAGNVSAQPLDVAALSLSAEFATQAVLKRPQLFRSLALISPTGMELRRAQERYQEGRSRENKTLRSVLRRSLIGSGLYRTLTTRAGVSWFLARTWGRPDFDPRLLETALRSARQPGAEHAALDFVAGALFTRGIVERYRALPLPVWVSHGTRGSFTDFGACPKFTGSRLQLNPLQRTAFAGGAMPHFEQPQAFAAAYDQFLASRFGAVPGRGHALDSGRGGTGFGAQRAAA